MIAPESSVPPGVASAPGTAPQPDFPRWPLRFVKVGLWCTLTLGSTWGAINLVTIHWALGRLPAAHNWIHASFQIWGFALLTLMGASYAVVPRWCGRPLAWVPLARATLWLDLAGMLALVWARFPHFVVGTVPAVVVGAVLHSVAVLGWAAVVTRTVLGAARPTRGWSALVFLGLGWWIGASVVLLRSAQASVGSGSADVSADYNEAAYAMTLLGGILTWLQALAMGEGTGLLPRLTRARTGFVVIQVGAIVMALSTRVGLSAGSSALHAVGGMLTALGLLIVTLRSGRADVQTGDAEVAASAAHERTFGQVFSAAAVLAATLMGFQAACEWEGRPSHRFIADGARHAVTLGLVSPSILSLALWLVPGDHHVEETGRFARGLQLIGVGLLLRETQVLAALLRWPDLVYVSGISGAVAAWGVGLASTVVLSRLRRIGDLSDRGLTSIS